MPTLTQFKLSGTPCFAKVHPSVTRSIQERFDGYHQSGMDIKQAMEMAVADHLKGLELDRKGMVEIINKQLKGTYAELLEPAPAAKASETIRTQVADIISRVSFGQFDAMFGPAKASARAEIMTLLAGENVPKSKAGITELERALKEAAGLSDFKGTARDLQDALDTWLYGETRDDKWKRTHPAAAEKDGPDTYWKGNKARYTGKTEELHGGTFYELELLEGHRKGDNVLTQKAPGSVAISLPFNVHRNFLRGLEEGAQDAALRGNKPAAPGDARRMAYTSGAKLQREVAAYEQGYNIAAAPDFIEKWRDNKNLLNYAIKSGLVEPDGWKFTDGWAEELTPARPVQPYTAEDHKTFIRSLVTGEATVDSLKSAYQDLLANKDILLQDLAKLKKDDLLKKLGGMAAYRYKNEKKEYVVKAVYSAMQDLFVLGRSLVYSPFGDGKGQALQALVDSTTADDLKAFAARFQKKEPVTRTTSTTAIDTPMGRKDNGYYLSSGDTHAMFTLRKRVDGVDRYVANLATDKTQAAWAADEWIGANETDEAMKVIYTGEVADDLRDIERAAPVQKPFDADAMDDPRPEAERIEDMTPADILAKNGLVVEQKTAKSSGKTYWSVSGNTKQHQATLDALGFAKPFKMGATWYRSVFDADPSERLANALVGTVEVKAYETLERDDATFYIQTKAGLTIVNENGKWYARGKNTYEFREALNEAGGRWINKTWGYEFNEDPTERLGATIKALVERAAAGEGTATDTGNGINPDEYERLQQLRNREDERADERITAEAIDGLISAESKDLIRRGIAFGVPAEVAADQIEDVAAINAAYRNKKPLYLLANGAGTGKTFVLGAAVRELRASGATKVLYITQSQDLISQIQRDLAAYGIDDVKFHTYAELSNKSSAPIDANGAVLIYDEAHNVKNVEGETAGGLSGQKLMGAAEFTILASATPYQNPVEARYLAGTGIFNSVGGFEEWAKMYGAAVRRYKRYNYQTGQNEVEEVVYWPGRGKKKDGAAARQWMFKQGVMANRPMKIDASMVDTQFRREKVDQKWVDLYDQVNAAYDDIINQWLDDDGNPRDAKITAEISRHRENAIKRVLESSKTNAAITRAKELLADGKNVVVFVETKSERVLGKWRRSQHFKDDTLYTYPQVQEMMLEWQAEAKAAQMMNERPPARPFAAFIVEIARTFHEFNLMQELPSTADEIQTALKEHGVGIYTGDVTAQAATRNKNDFLAGRLKVLVATMAKGGTGLSLHDTVGTRPTVQLNLNLPWAAWQVDQVAARVARYGLKSKAVIEWLFASNIPWETTKLAPRVGARMSDMGAIVNGVEMKSAEKLLGDFDFEGVFDVKQAAGEGIIDLEADAGSPDFGTDEYAVAQRLENGRMKATDTSNGYFATPYPLAVLMKRIAGVRDGERVLEPSAGGIGALIKFLPETVHVTAVEQRLDNYESLQRLYGTRSNMEITRGDFMEFKPTELFDAILMNPPFERKEGVGAQDVAHVMKAFDHLAPGGRLVAIMGEGAFFRGFKQETAFREWLDEIGATVIKMPEGAFRKSGTMVRTRMLVIDKDNADFRSDLSLGDMDPGNLKAVEAMVPGRVNDEPSYSRAQRRQPADKVVSKPEIAAYAEELLGNGVNRPWLKVVENVADLPFKAPNDAHGARLGNTIYVVASNVVDAADVRAVVFHEAVGHYGLHGFFGAQIWSALDLIHKNNPLIQEYAAAWVKSNGDVIKEQQLSASAARYRSIEEAMARLAEDGKPYTYALSLVRKVQELLRMIGLDGLAAKIESKTNAQALQMLNNAKLYIERGQSVSDSIVEPLFPQFMTAWHGSPHSHDRFSTSAIGTGEGNQTYGYGLYFAGAKEVAEHYREVLGGYKVSLDGREIKMDGESNNMTSAIHTLEWHKRDVAKAVQDLKEKADNPFYERGRINLLNQAKWLENNGNRLQFETTGRLYHVELAPAEDEYLLWDKPLNEQSDKVKKLLSDDMGVGIIGKEQGRTLYHHLSSNMSLGSDKAASEYLHSLGIRGIKYLDGSSRNRPLREIKAEFLAELPEDVTFDEVEELIGTGKFSAKNDALLKALAADDWLGFDYPAQAVSAALGKNLNGFDPSPGLLQVVESVQEGGTYNYVIFNDEDIEIKAVFSRPNAPTIEAARDFISNIKPGDIAKVLPGNLAKSANETFPKIMDAMGWLFNVPVFQGERDARGRKDGDVGINDFVSTGIHRAENNMEFQLEMQGWDGLDPNKPRKTPTLWQRLKSATTQWESTDTSTEWGRIEQEVRSSLDPKQQAALDIMQREGDVSNTVYETLADAMKNKRIAAAAPSEAAFTAYKRVRGYIDGPMMAARERLIARLGEATGADKELVAKTIASFRAHMGKLAGWMPRKHGEGVHQVNVHHVVKALPFRSAAMGDDHLAILPFYAGKDVGREIRTFARANGLTVFRNAIGAPIVVASTLSGEKIRKKIEKLEDKLAKTVIVELQEQLQAKIDDLQAKLAIVERPPVDRIADFMEASKSFLTNIRAEYEVQLEDLRGQLETAKAEGAHISEIRKLKAEIGKLGDGRVKVKAYMRLNETQRRAEKHLADVKGNLEKHLDHVFHKGEQYETTYTVINPTSEGMYGDIAGDFAAENIIKEAIERAQQHGRINNEDAASVRNALFRNYADVMLARGAGRHQIKRAPYLIAGYDQTDTNQLYHDYMTAAAGMLSKAMYAKQQFDNYRYAPNEIKPWAEKYIKETLRNMGHTDRIGANVRAVATFMYLGLKMSSILVNGTQTWTLGVAELGRRTKQNSLKAVGRAQLDILKSRLTKDEQALFDNQLWKEQEMATAIHEMSGHGEGVTGKISKQLHILVGKSLLPFQEMEMLNRRTMVLAAYRSFLADGLSREDAIEQAMDVNRKTNFEMSRANLPEFAQHPVGRTAYALQSFVWNNWNWIYNRATSGEKADMLALLKYAAMISAIGGVAALAGGDEINKLLRRLTGKDYRLAMEIWTRKHAKEYGTAGELLNAMVWHGGVGALGVNISNAMRLNVPMSGFITGDTTAGESAMGIWSGLYDKGANAAKFAARGQYERAIESAAPAFIEAGMKAHRMATEGATTTHGKPVLDEHGRKLKYSGLDAAKRAVGLQPIEQSFRAEATQAGVKVKAYWSEQRGTLLDTLRMADTSDARKAVMKDIMKFNKDVRKSQAWPMVNVITASSIQHSRAASAPDKKKTEWLRKTVE